MNILTLLTQDHRNVDELFSRAERADAGDATELAHLRDKIVEHLSVHAAVEEEVFYPGLRQAGDEELDGMVLEALEEHHAAKATLAELEKLLPTAERFRPKLTVLIENVRHHVEEEEGELFAKVREVLKTQQLEDMGEAAEEAKQTAPTRPHPLQPDQPSLNAILGPPVAAVDKVITTVRQTVERVLLRRTG